VAKKNLGQRWALVGVSRRSTDHIATTIINDITTAARGATRMRRQGGLQKKQKGVVAVHQSYIWIAHADVMDQ